MNGSQENTRLLGNVKQRLSELESSDGLFCLALARVCAWCGLVVSPGDAGTTHTICDVCRSNYFPRKRG